MLLLQAVCVWDMRNKLIIFESVIMNDKPLMENEDERYYILETQDGERIMIRGKKVERDECSNDCCCLISGILIFKGVLLIIGIVCLASK